MELLERTAFLATLAEYAAEARRGDGRLVLAARMGIGSLITPARGPAARRDRAARPM